MKNKSEWNYQKLLKTKQWKIFAEKVKEKAGWKCENCDAVDKPLHAHHIKYVKGRKPWQYDLSLMQSLCEDCHSGLHFDQHLEFEECMGNCRSCKEVILGMVNLIDMHEAYGWDWDDEHGNLLCRKCFESDYRETAENH